MAETQTAVATNKVIYKEYFDMDSFDTVTVGAQIELPAKPASLSEVQQLFQGNEGRLLDIIYSGMVKEAEVNADKQPDLMWRSLDDEGELTDELYDTSRSADSDKKKVINDFILSFAKAAFGFTTNKGRDPKVREANQKAKDAAKQMIKNNPAMLDAMKKS